MRLVVAIVIAAIALSTAPARAQYTNSYGYSFNNPVSATAFLREASRHGPC